VSASAVAVSWTGWLHELARSPVNLPEVLTNAPLFTDNHFVVTGALFNLPAVAIVR
jgi:APA family basic amino acid/polyamine antiporter